MNEELKVIISAETEKVVKEVDKAKKTIKSFGDVSEEQMKAFDEYLESAKKTCANAMKAIGVAIAGAIASMVALSETTRELRNNQAKLETAFENAGSSAETAAKTYDELYRVLGDDGKATEAAQHLAKLTNNQEELAEWTDICKGVYAEFGDSLAIEGLTEAVNHTAKLGEVQGTLADALEWSGTSVEQFNEELAACSDEAEREKKIREKLNEIYKTSADRYERNNDAVLKANDAQNKLNKALSKHGEYMEPVTTELKNLGASFLEDMQKPMKEVTQWVTNKFFPALKKTYTWIKSNLPAITGIIVGATTAYVGYKVAVVAAEMAEKGLTVARIAAAAAQKVLNAAMAANPIGLVATAIAALIAGLIAYSATLEDTAPKVGALTAEEQELVARTLEAAEAFKEQKQTIEEDITAIDSTYTHTEKLAEELLNLADVNGQVKEADKARAEFILGQLNEALGTEYSMVGDIIQGYGDLKQSIYDLIEAKKANIMLEAQESGYAEAIGLRQDAVQGLVAAEKDYQAALEQSTQATKTAEEERRILNEKMAKAQSDAELRALVGEAERIKRMEDDAKRLREITDEKKGVFDEAAAHYGRIYETINEYERASQLILEGNSAEAIKVLQSKGQAFSTYAEGVDESTKLAVDALFQEALDAGLAAQKMKEDYEKGIGGYTAEQIAEAEQAHADLLEEWATAYDEANGIGTNLGNGIISGMSDTREKLVSYAKGLVSSIFGAMKKAADMHSPSKKAADIGRNLGKGTEIGLDDSSKGVIKSSENMVKKSLKAIQGFAATDFSGAINNSALKANQAVMMNRSIAGPEANSILGALGAKLGTDTPIILQVDGKVFAETAISTINQRTRQTGQLALNLM